MIWSDVVGVLMWATGLTIEAVADAQKFRFKMDPANKGRFIDTGLWKYSRCVGAGIDRVHFAAQRRCRPIASLTG